MNAYRIALANLRIPTSPEDSVALAEQAVAQAANEKAALICFPECFIPGYRILTAYSRPADPAFVERAWSTIRSAAAKVSITVVLGTERAVDGRRLLTALVINQDGSIAGFQDKVQLDPSEEAIYPKFLS